ncbi:unnamed protein product [Parascedosporium putredinis]|uniref:Uncharacterized protein n=1 Tax=Parascedosporium putredinis TaxID=1442378 RepID=A0A9P1GU55_9PEZI|nr:unnamed protein product [Parascedosporium putredinis]CAI7987393.1 unnamed protein product [Parascedosporium putredinis]
MRVNGFPLYAVLWGIFCLARPILASNEAFGSLMLFLYNAYRFDETVSNGKPGLANQCSPKDSDGPSSKLNRGCNFHGFLRHVLRSSYDPSAGGMKKVSDPWMPTETEVVDLHKWSSVNADAGYNAARVMGSSGNYFNSHLMFRVVAARVKKLAASDPAVLLRADNAAQMITKTESLLGGDKSKLVKADDENLVFRDVVLLRDDLSFGVGGEGADRCSGRNRDSDQRDKDDKKEKDENNQSCKKPKRSLLDSFANMLFKRQNGGGSNNNCQTKTETIRHARPKGTESMTIFTCNDGVAMGQSGSATAEWGSTAKANGKPAEYAQHNYAWSANKDNKGKKAQRVRLIPQSDNGPAGTIWKGFCDLTGEYGPMTKTKVNGANKVIENVDLYLRARPADVNQNLGADKTMTETTTSYVKTGRAVFSLQFEDQKFKLPNDGLDDNPCLPDIVRGTDPGWALLTYDEYYDRNPDLQQYTALYKNVVVPAALPPIVPPAPPPPRPPPPRRLRRGTRADWDEVVVIDTDEETCINGGMGRLREMEDDYQEFRRQQGGVEDPRR